MKKYITLPFMALLLIANTGCTQTTDEKKVRQEVMHEMDILYDKMRHIDLSWMDYLSPDATAVHNGTFLPHQEFVNAEQGFFEALSKLEINIRMKPVIYVLGPDAASVTICHSINTWYKNGQNFNDVKQTLTFIWQRRNGKWYTVHSHFVTAGETNK